MKILLTILIIFLFVTTKAQSYVLQWESTGHTKYAVFQSADNTTWKNIYSINRNLTDTTFSYTLPMPVKFNYYKVVADNGTDSSKTIYVNNITPTISIQLNYEIKLQ